MQWVFKELSTEAGFPQTIITSTPGTPNFLSWYFFFFHLLFFANLKGENPPHPDDFLSPVRVGALSRLEPKLCGTSIFSSARGEELCEGVADTKGRVTLPC